MNNNRFHLTFGFFIGILTLLLFPSNSYSQTVTGTVSTRLFHNTSATSNSMVTYYVDLSNGWKPGISSITSLVLKNAGGTTIYTHSGASTNYGTVSSALAPGVYTFIGTISTKDNSNNTVSVSVNQDFWVGYKVEWAKSLDLATGKDQYSLKRSNMSTGITRAYAESFNSLAANTAGWIEMSAPSNTNAGSSVFFVLEALSNPSTFSPSDNITYVEYFYTNSSTKGVRVKARNASNVYTMYTLSGVVLGDKLRFERDGSGNAKLYLNGTSTVSHAFAKTLTAAMTVYVHATLSTDEATGVVTSFGYPNTNFPLANTFNEDKSTGDLTIRINPLSGFQSPYHYFVSEQPIPELKDVYKFLKDSVVGGPVDSTTFFNGPVSPTNFTTNGIPMGNYYVSAFDSRGVRIYSNNYSLLPTVTWSDRSNVNFAYDEFISCAPNAYISPNFYMTDLTTNASVVFNLTDINAEQTFGLLVPTDVINSGGNPYSKIEYGFYVKNGLLYTVEKGVQSSTSVTAVIGVPIEIVKSGSDIKLISNGTVLKTIAANSTFQYKVGTLLTAWGTKLKIKPIALTKLPFRVPYTLSNNACTNAGINLSLTYPATTFHGVTITSKTFNLYNPAGAAVGTTNQTSFTNLTPGVYHLVGNVVAGSTIYYDQYVYVGYTTAWNQFLSGSTDITNIYPQNTANMPPTPHAIGNTSVNPSTGVFGQAIGTGRLSASTAGWMVFTPKSVSGSNGNWQNLVSLTEAPQFNMLNSPAATMPSMTFPIAGGMMLVNNPTTQTYQVRYYSPGIPIVAERDGSGVFKLSQNAVQLGGTISGYYFGRWKPAFLIRKPNSGFYSILSNFPCPASTGQYAHLKYDLDGYYHVMTNCNINFVYNEEYNASTLTFNIYSSNMVKLFDQSNFPTVPVTLGDNRISLFVGDDPHCLGLGQFVLEVINSKKEHFYLRFYNGNCSGCTPPIEGEGQ